ncbi:alpha/beta fold hydrolase [Microscilla marina]|uniref:Hydrolase, alpha/beta hydrolase fold family, putative n=1 Tax=Microscilla marina ATCC 23134 TaxID=313606 RepID=A1ZDG2_MICM2|nr:alpha/beta hydrolase [Microscilla marina]EAY31701.1 hydrolase, alpha/beta hydrolase fold family, putative [Microscilla marina ATCC 23134]
MKKLPVIFISLITSLILGITAVVATPDNGTKAFKVTVTGTNKSGNILFIPGLGCPGEVWNETVAVFKKEYACHVFTLAGFAGQPALKTNAMLPVVKDQIITYIDKKQLKNVTLIGHSLGGFMSFWIAAERPNLIQKLVSVDGLPFLGGMQNPAATSQSMQPIAQQMKEQMLKPVSKEVAKKNQLRTVQAMISSEARIKQVLQWNLKSDPKAIAQAMYELYTIDLRQQVANIKAPTLVMGVWWGKEYGAPLEAVKKNYTRQIARIPQHQFLMHKSAKHFIMYDDKTWMIQKLRAFLKGAGFK